MKTSEIIGLFLLSGLWYPAATHKTPRSYTNIRLSEGAAGAESIAFDCKGDGPYVGVADGRILKWRPSLNNWTDFARISPNWTRRCSEFVGEKKEADCGRPLGLKFNYKTCELYIADAYHGLMVVGPRGGRARTLSNSVDGLPFKFLNGLDIDYEAGLVYFTDSSTRFQRWEFSSIYSTNDSTGRLIKYNIRTQSTELLLKNLAFANGVALSKNRDFVLVAVSPTGQVRRFWLKGSRSGQSDIFIQLEALPDNINTNQEGDFWIAQYPPEMFFLPRFRGSGDKGLSVKVSQEGKVLVVLDDDASKNTTITTSNVIEFGGRLWFGSAVDNYILVSNN